MFRCRLLVCLILVATAGFASGQTSPILLTVYPPGAKVDSSAEVTVSGTNLDGADSLLFSDPRVKAELVPGSVAADPKTKQPGGMAAGSATTARFKVTVTKDTRIGTLDVRAVTKAGLSNPRAFVIGELAEVTEKEPNNDGPEAQVVDPNTTVSGMISTPTDVDYVAFRAKAGQNIVVSCLTTAIDSKLQADLMVIGPDGKPLVANRGYFGGLNGDAVLDFLPPGDGIYLVRVSQFAYITGGSDHFYRLTITTKSWDDAIFPPVTPSRDGWTTYGRNLPGGKPANRFNRPDGRPFDTVRIDPGFWAKSPGLRDIRHLVPPAAAAVDIADFSADYPDGNPLLVSTAPLVLDNSDNDTPEKAQVVSLPCDIAGRIEKKNDRDWYVFEAKKGDVWTLEVFADRLGSPVDAFFILTDEKGKVIAEVDDSPETLSPNQFYTRSDDPTRYRFTAPADGKYRVMVSTREAGIQYGVRDQYVLRIAAEKPDFRLAIMPFGTHYPDAGTLPKNGAVLLSVFVFRMDGFTGPITLTAENLPPGVSCPPQTIGAGQTRGTLVLTATPSATDWAGFVTVTGTAENLSHTARPFTITWPVPGVPLNQPAPNVPMITRMDRGPGLALAIRGEAPFHVVPTTTEAISTRPGEKIEIAVKIERKEGFKDSVEIFSGTPNIGPRPQGNKPAAPIATIEATKADAKLSLDIPMNLPPGTYSIVLLGRSGAPQPKGPQGARLAPTYPAIPVTVIVEGKTPPKKK